MAVIKRFNFMAAGKPLMHIDLFGDSLDLYTPSKGAYDAFLAANDRLIASLEKIAEKPDADELTEDVALSVMDVYNIAGELISFNTAGVAVTGKDLLEKYEVSGEALLVFFHEYADFLAKIQNSKN